MDTTLRISKLKYYSAGASMLFQNSYLYSDDAIDVPFSLIFTLCVTKI